MPRRLFWVSFFLIVIGSAVIRFWQLGKIPVSLYWDEAAMLVDVKSVVQTGKDMHNRPWYQVIYPSYGDYKLPMYIWSASLSAKVFGVNEFSLRFPSALAGVLTVVVAGWLARLLLTTLTQTKYSAQFLDQLQLWTMLMVAISPWSIMFSRTGFEGHLGQMLLASSLATLLWTLSQKKRSLFWLPAVLGAAATYAYFSVRFVWIGLYPLAGVLLMLVSFLEQPRHNLETGKRYLPDLAQLMAGVLVFLLLLLPLVKSPLYQDSNRFRLGTASVLNNDQLVLESNLYKELAGNTLIDRVIYHRDVLMGRELAKNYSDNLSFSFLFLQGDPNLRHGTGQFGLFLFPAAGLFVLGIIILLHRHKMLGFFLCCWWLSALLPASVPENTPHALRSLNALAPLAVILGLGGAWIWQKLNELKTPLTQLIGKGAVAVMLGLSFLHFWWFYQAIYPSISANDWQSGYAPLARTLTSLTQDGKELFIKEFDDRFYLWLLAYGPYLPQDFQHWQTKDYKFVGSGLEHHFDHLHFAWPNDTEILNTLAQHRQLILVGTQENIRLVCQPQGRHCQVDSVKDEAGKEKFAVATLTNAQ